VSTTVQVKPGRRTLGFKTANGTARYLKKFWARSQLI